MNRHKVNISLVVKYIVAGSFVATVQLLVFLFLFKLLTIGYLTASVIAFVIALVTSFLVQRGLVFVVEGKRAVQTGVAFSIIFLNSLLGLSVNCLIMYGGVEYGYDSATVWQVVSMVTIAAYNFFFYRFLFRPQSL